MSVRGEEAWARLARGARPTAGIATIENPLTVVRLVVGTLVGTVIITGLVGFLMIFYGENTAGRLTVGLAVLYALVLLWFVATGQVVAPGVVATLASVANVILVHLTLGGYAYSGGHFAWGISLTFAVLILLGRREGLAAASVFAVMAIVFAFLEPSLQASRSPPAPGLRAFLFAGVLVGNLTVVVAVLIDFLRRVGLERERAENLLLNVLPAEVADELKEHGFVRPKRFDGVSVVFADIVGFTETVARGDPEELVDRLNQIFTEFDALTARYGCEKIRTIGDAYMVAAGVPVERQDHARVAAALALEMLASASGGPLTFRIGINSGPVVAGVIGSMKFQYDVWGDTVNTASRMESHGVPGRIQISEATYRLIRDEFVCTPRGIIQVKGKGELATWFLEGHRSGEE